MFGLWLVSHSSAVKGRGARVSKGLARSGRPQWLLSVEARSNGGSSSGCDTFALSFPANILLSAQCHLALDALNEHKA
jgi:hypothetical protein